jgi:quinolinate synthase
MASSTVFLDLLGPQRASEKGTTCPGDLPPASDPELVERASAARATLGDRAFVLGHHYQRDEVIQFADARGDSFRLAQQAAARPEAKFVVFCGVHFMAESADILTGQHQQVILPDLPPAAPWPTWRPGRRSTRPGRSSRSGCPAGPCP